MLVVKATVFSGQFLISYMVIPVITYSLDKLVFNTLAITLNVLLKAILRIHGIYMLLAGWEVRIRKNCDRGLENAARGRRPRAAFSSPRSQF